MTHTILRFSTRFTVCVYTYRTPLTCFVAGFNIRFTLLLPMPTVRRTFSRTDVMDVPVCGLFVAGGLPVFAPCYVGVLVPFCSRDTRPFQFPGACRAHPTPPHTHTPPDGLITTRSHALARFPYYHTAYARLPLTTRRCRASVCVPPPTVGCHYRGCPFAYWLWTFAMRCSRACC